MIGFGLSFAGAAAVHVMIALPPSAWPTPLCDTISIVYLVAAAATGAVFAILAQLTVGSMWARLAAGLTGGAAVAAVVLSLFPQCLAGPYAGLDPWLMTNWIERISEARPLWQSFGDYAPYLVGGGIPVLLGLMAALAVAWRRAGVERQQWLLLALFMGAALAVTVVQVRGIRLAACLAVPAAAWVIVMMRRRYVRNGRMLAAAGLVAAWLVFASLVPGYLFEVAKTALARPQQPAAAAVAGSAVLPHPSRGDCYRENAFATLGKQPAQRLMAPVDLGSHIVLFTPHAVVGAPYHRNQRGVRDAFSFFSGPIEAGRQILMERGITLAGGGALLRGMDRLLQEHTLMRVKVARDPLTCVVMGTGIVVEQMHESAHIRRMLEKASLS